MPTEFVSSVDAPAASQIGPATPDHTIYTKRLPCFVPIDGAADAAATWAAVERALDAFTRDDTAYVDAPSLDAITGNQIQATQAQSFGALFFAKPGATSTGLAPGASRPVLRGLSDFRVRVQENGIGSMDLSDYGQDHGVPIDPLSVQKIEIYRDVRTQQFYIRHLDGRFEPVSCVPPGLLSKSTDRE